ncbi:protein of unknown function [Methanoculleus bourgensis]|uniref:Uncharacterized protein n=1 Tax=Methanoculleus bourgensis TaxID=83986 RepID=A0A0X3BQ19_9EURY|nr:protein of unknown function [Methanoculleus bourgensis]
MGICIVFSGKDVNYPFTYVDIGISFFDGGVQGESYIIREEGSVTDETGEGREVDARIDRTRVFPVSPRTVDRGGHHHWGEGVLPPPLSHQGAVLVTPPLPACGLLPRPGGRGQCVGISSGKPCPGMC